MRRALTILLAAGCLMSAQAEAQEVECYIIFWGQLWRLTYSYAGPGDYQQTDEVSVGYLETVVDRMAMTPDGQLIGLNQVERRLVTIDTATAAITPLVDIDIPGWLDDDSDMAIDAAGHAYLSQESKLYALDLTTGDTTLIGDTGVNLTALGSLGYQLYGAGWSPTDESGVFFRLDRTTGQPSSFSSWWGSYIALTSNWRELWGVWSDCSTMAGWNSVVVLDPTTGVPGAWLWEFGGGGYDCRLIYALQVRGPGLQSPRIPLLTRPLLVLLALLLAAAGVIAVRRLVS